MSDTARRTRRATRSNRHNQIFQAKREYTMDEPEEKAPAPRAGTHAPAAAAATPEAATHIIAAADSAGQAVTTAAPAQSASTESASAPRTAAPPTSSSSTATLTGAITSGATATLAPRFAAPRDNAPSTTEVARPSAAAPMLSLGPVIGSSAPPPGHYLDPSIRPWRRYDLSGAIAPDPLDTMVQLWHRTRNLRGKPTDTHDVYALEYSSCAFIKRWNACRAAGGRYIDWMELEEDRRQLRSLGALRERVCEMAWNEDRICLVSINEFCRYCTHSGERPTRADWDAQVAARPLGDREREWVERYERALWEHRGAARRGEQGRTRSPARAARGRSRDRDQDPGRASRSPRARSRGPSPRHWEGGARVQDPRQLDDRRQWRRSRSLLPERSGRETQRRSRSRSQSPRRTGIWSVTEAIRASPSPPPTRSSRRRAVEVPQGWHHTREPYREYRGEGRLEAPMFHSQGESQANVRDIGAAQARRHDLQHGDWHHAPDWDPRGRQCVPQSSDVRHWSRSEAAAHHGGMASGIQGAPRHAAPSWEELVIAGSEQAANVAEDARELADAAHSAAGRADATAASARQSAEELRARVRLLERQFHGCVMSADEIRRLESWKKP